MPPTKAEPEVGMTRVVSMPAVVVLPAPLGPSKPKISRACTTRSRLSTALKSVPGYVFVKPTVRMTSAVGGRGSTRVGSVVVNAGPPVVVDDAFQAPLEYLQF